MAITKIDSDALKSASGRLLEIEESVRSLAVEIQNCAQELQSGYKDEVGILFVQKIGELDGDIQQMIAMIDEHGQELATTAEEVKNALEEGRGRASALPTDVIN